LVKTLCKLSRTKWLPSKPIATSKDTTIPSTSCQAERSFSAAGRFVTILRSSLKDKTIDTLWSLRSYLMQS
ncbi:hypothetical protein T07_857, partial [Trichinella nelsoni]